MNQQVCAVLAGASGAQGALSTAVCPLGVCCALQPMRIPLGCLQAGKQIQVDAIQTLT